MTDRPTYQLIKEKRQNAVELLYQRYGKKLYSYGISHWKLDEDSSWELVYKTLYKVVETIDRYDFETEAKFGSFLFKIFINYLRNHYRDEKRMKEHLDVVNFHESQHDSEERMSIGREVEKKVAKKSMEEAEQDEDQGPSLPIALLRAELEQLEDWQRMLLLMRSQNIAYSEISKHVGKPETQLKVYYQRLKDKLMKKLTPQLQHIIKQ